MAAYLVGHIRVKDVALWQRYVAGVAESLAPFAAEIIFRGRLARVLAGEHDHDLVVVIRFSEQNTLERWYSSEKYQSLVPLRDRAADVIIASYRA